jgi:hypothetical protein
METDETPPLESKEEFTEIDLSGVNMAYSIGAQGSSYGTITTSAGANGTSGSFYYTGGTAIPNWNNFSNITISGKTHPTPSLNVTGDAEFEGDVKIKGVSISKTLEAINDRLAILQPDPAKLEHFAALKKAYEHYKTLEALCEIPKKENEE